MGLLGGSNVVVGGALMYCSLTFFRIVLHVSGDMGT